MSKILIVDDERHVIQHVSALLKTLGYEFGFMPKPELAIQKMDSEDFDLILLDINMSGMTGLELLTKIKNHPTHKEKAVVMMTGDTNDNTLAKCFELGADDYITKPINELVLRARVKSVMDRQQYIQEVQQQQRAVQEKNRQLEDKQEEITYINEALEEQVLIADKANKAMKASINYASRIQKAILPMQESISQSIPRHFILFKPRDVISGDFYWHYRSENKAVIAAIDSTGHGVPGAMMSMIGDSILHRIVADQQLFEPNHILHQAHEAIVDALKQRETNNKDGMDVAICVIDFNAGKMLFSGAKNPLIYFQHGEMHRIKGDNYPIGGEQLETERRYSCHEVDLTTPTTFYVYTDGFKDQFGGEQGRKFMTSNFHQLLADVHHLEMQEQKRKLDQTISDWMGSRNPQTDDILVIGGHLDFSS
jgi:DNA-binding response OmpR family regulator